MSWIERLRQKPDSQKKAIALAISIAVTVVIAVLWILARIAMQNE